MAGPLWALGGAALGLCLARVAGQLVEVRRGGAEGSGRLWPAGRRLRGRPSDWELDFPLPTAPADLDSWGDTALPPALPRCGGDSAPNLRFPGLMRGHSPRFQDH